MGTRPPPRAGFTDIRLVNSTSEVLMYVTYLHLFTSVQVKLSSLSFAYMNRQLMKQSLFTLYVQTSSSETALGDG